MVSTRDWLEPILCNNSGHFRCRGPGSTRGAHQGAESRILSGRLGPSVGLAIEVLNEFPEYEQAFQARREQVERDLQIGFPIDSDIKTEGDIERRELPVARP